MSSLNRRRFLQGAALIASGSLIAGTTEVRAQPSYVTDVTSWLTPVPPGTFEDPQVTSYLEDSGADIYVPKGTPIRAVADATILYSEWGHVQQYPGHEAEDTRNSILLALGTPLDYNGFVCPYVWYTHLSEITHDKSWDDPDIQISKGTLLGKSGIGRGVPHLHFGIIRDIPQRDGDFLPPFTVARLVGTMVGGPTVPVFNQEKLFEIYFGLRHNAWKARAFTNREEVHDAHIFIEIEDREFKTLRVDGLDTVPHDAQIGVRYNQGSWIQIYARTDNNSKTIASAYLRGQQVNTAKIEIQIEPDKPFRLTIDGEDVKAENGEVTVRGTPAN